MSIIASATLASLLEFETHQDTGLLNRFMIVRNTKRKSPEFTRYCFYHVNVSECDEWLKYVDRLLEFYRPSGKDAYIDNAGLQAQLGDLKYAQRKQELKDEEEAGKADTLKARMTMHVETIARIVHYLKCFENNVFVHQVEQKTVDEAIAYYEQMLAPTYNEIYKRLYGAHDEERREKIVASVRAYMRRKAVGPSNPLKWRELQRNCNAVKKVPIDHLKEMLQGVVSVNPEGVIDGLR